MAFRSQRTPMGAAFPEKPLRLRMGSCHYLDASRWEQTDVFRQNLAHNAYHRIASLQQPEHVELLVQQIKQVLGTLRETIRAQFSLLQQRYDDYKQQCARTNSKYALSKRTIEAYSAWQSRVRGV
jgi:hypothetical protein